MARPPRKTTSPPRPPRAPRGNARNNNSPGEEGKSPGDARRGESRKVADAWGVSFAKPKRENKPRPGTPSPDNPRKQDRASPAGARDERPAAQPRRAFPPRKHGAPQQPTRNPHPARAATAPGEEGPQRIAKLLARAGVASRREIERMIADGRVTLGGKPVETPATLLPSLNGVAVDGVAIAEPEATRLFLFHKPSGCLTTERDPAGRPTIYDRLPADLPRVMPVGRLDMTTEGLLLLTTDGAFKREMELPATGVERTYRARAFGEVSQAQLEELIDGVEVDGMYYGRIDANLERRTGRNQWIEMTLTEGKNREVRRVLEHLGLKVNRLIRTRYGTFELGDSVPGELVEVKPNELAAFRKSLERGPA